MTDKDPKDMTVSEMLRLAAGEGEQGGWTGTVRKLAYLVGISDLRICELNNCDLLDESYKVIADKIDAELAEARELSLLAGAELWAKANGWPDFREGEDFGAWLERCAIPRPRFDDEEPVQSSDMEEIGAMATYRVYMDGSWEFEPDKYEDETSPKPWDAQFGTRNDRVKRPAPEALGADGLPIVAGETVHPIYGAWFGIPLEVIGIEQPASVKVSLPSGKGWTHFQADCLTHTPPDTLERLRDDITEWRADCANPGSGWDVKTAEWAARIDAIIRRKGSAE